MSCNPATCEFCAPQQSVPRKKSLEFPELSCRKKIKEEKKMKEKKEEYRPASEFTARSKGLLEMKLRRAPNGEKAR